MWKVLLGLALVLPMGAYVAGSLMSSAADMPTPREPVIIRDADPSPEPPPSRPRDEPPAGGDDVPDDEPGDDVDDVDDNGLRIVTPEPTRMDDDDDRDEDEDEDDHDTGDD